jgi:hypothetical protein
MGSLLTYYNGTNEARTCEVFLAEVSRAATKSLFGNMIMVQLSSASRAVLTIMC